MLDQRTAQLGIAIRNVAKWRGIELTEEQIEGYLFALQRYEPEAVMAAGATLFRDSDSRNMPTPKEIMDQIRRAYIESHQDRTAIEGDKIPEDEQAFGLKCFPILQRMMAKEITLGQAEAEMDEQARVILCDDAKCRYFAAAEVARA